MNPIKLTTALLFSAIIYSCGSETNTAVSEQNATTSISEESNNTSSGDVLSLSEAKKIDKLNYLVATYNEVSIPAYDDYEDYVEAYGSDPDKFKRISRYSENDMNTSTLEDLDKAVEIDGFNELNPLIIQYKNAGMELAKLINELDKYHEMNDFEMDDYAKVKGMHKSVLEAYNTFFPLENELRYKSDLIQDEMELDRLEKLKESGDTYNYLIGMTLVHAKAMLTESQMDDVFKLDANKLKEQSLKVRQVYDEITQYIEEHPEVQEDFDIKQYLSGYKKFTLVAQDLYVRVRDKRRYSTGEKMMLDAGSGSMNDGSPEKLLNEYNNIINYYNRSID